MKTLARLLCVLTLGFAGLSTTPSAQAQEALDRPFLFYGVSQAILKGANSRYTGGRVHGRTELNPGALINFDFSYAIRRFSLSDINDVDYTNASVHYQQVFEAAPTHSISGLLGAAYGEAFNGFARGDELSLSLGALGEIQLGATGAVHGKLLYHGAAGFGLGYGLGATHYFASGTGIRIDYMIYERVQQGALMFGYAL